MKVPNKFWFYNNNNLNKDIIYFAEGDEYEYVISASNMQNITQPRYLVESFIDVGDWVLTVPSKFKVRSVLTDTIYSLIKDANSLYVVTGEQTTSPIFLREDEVLDCLYGEKPRWEVYTEEKVEEPTKELTTPDNFKFRHRSDCGLIFSAKRYKNLYWITWVDYIKWG